MTHTPPTVEPSGGTAVLWYALFGGPVAWFLGLIVGYFIVTPSCDAGDELPLHLVSAAALLIAAGAVLAGYVRWQGAGVRWPDERGGRVDRSRFVAALGTLIGALFALVIVAQWAVTTVHQPCWTLPRLPDRPDARAEPVRPLAPPTAFVAVEEEDARHGCDRPHHRAPALADAATSLGHVPELAAAAVRPLACARRHAASARAAAAHARGA